MGRKIKKRTIYIALTAILIEIVLFQTSFWKTAAAQEVDLTAQAQVFYGHVNLDGVREPELPGTGKALEYSKAAADQDISRPVVMPSADGFVHVPEKEVLLAFFDLDCEIERIHLDISLPEGEAVQAAVYMQDEGNRLPYQLTAGQALYPEVERSLWMKTYPYGKVKNLYVQIKAPAGQGELAFSIKSVGINGRMPFSFSPVRLAIVLLVLLFADGMRSASGWHKISFWPENCSKKERRSRRLAIGATVLVYLLLAFFFVTVNPRCRTNLAPHHAQYQELAQALSQGKVSVGEADAALMAVENPYDTIYLQAEQIPYRADYAYQNGSYYVYFGIVPELLLYLPCYLLTGHQLPNFAAFGLFYGGFVLAAAGLCYELMRRFFARLPFYFYPIGLGILTGSYPLFYLLIRPDLYNVPIVASCMFTAAAFYFYLAGLSGRRGRGLYYLLGSLCMAANAGCRPQFLLFGLLAIPLFWPEIFKSRSLFSEKGVGETAALVLPYLLTAAGIMYYNWLRFGSPFDFGAAYSMTSNDMTHRGFNLERIFYSLWYDLFALPHIEGTFPYLRSLSIETDYIGRMTTESCYGGIFVCSMLFWPVFFLKRAWLRLRQRKLAGFTALAVLASLLICCVDATGAGILQRYMADMVWGFALAAFILLCLLAEWAKDKQVYGHFAGWLAAAILLHLVFLLLVLLHTEGTVNLRSGAPELFYKIWAMLRF